MSNTYRRQTHKGGLLQIADQAKHNKDRASRRVVEDRVLDTSLDKVLDGDAMPPLQNVRTKAVVGKSLGRVYENIATEFQMNIEGLSGGTDERIRDLIRVVSDGPSKNEYVGFRRT